MTTLEQALIAAAKAFLSVYVIGDRIDTTETPKEKVPKGSGSVPGPTKPIYSNGLPTCPIHGVPLKPSTNPAWKTKAYCPEKNPDGSYCKTKEYK